MGRISRAERGDNGFGFDSIFIPSGSMFTFGEMSGTQKNKESHRFRALRRLAKWYLAPEAPLYPPDASGVLK